MRIYLPDVKQKKGEAVPYQYEGKIPGHFGLGGEGDNFLRVDLDARGSADKIILNGTVEVMLEAECSRCLQNFEQRFRNDFTESFTVVPEEPGKDDPEVLAAEAANQLVVSGDYLYIDEYIRQVLILALTYNPLCKADCKGLCAGCGVDLNREPCLCKDEMKVDERLLKLKELIPGS